MRAAGRTATQQRRRASRFRDCARAMVYFDFVPYFERLCLRPVTPLASSVPRTM